MIRHIAVALALSTLVLSPTLPASAETMVLRDSSGKDKVVEVPDGKNPWLTGIASLVIPGVGEMINGDVAWGAGVLAANIGLGVVALNTTDPNLAGTMGGARIGLNIGSCIGAAMRSNELNTKRDEFLKIHTSNLPDEEKELKLKSLR